MTRKDSIQTLDNMEGNLHKQMGTIPRNASSLNKQILLNKGTRPIDNQQVIIANSKHLMRVSLRINQHLSRWDKRQYWLSGMQLY